MTRAIRSYPLVFFPVTLESLHGLFLLLFCPCRLSPLKKANMTVSNPSVFVISPHPTRRLNATLSAAQNCFLAFNVSALLTFASLCDTQEWAADNEISKQPKVSLPSC